MRTKATALPALAIATAIYCQRVNGMSVSSLDPPTQPESILQRNRASSVFSSRRSFVGETATVMTAAAWTAAWITVAPPLARAAGDDENLVSLSSGDEVGKLFKEGRALESQGNLAAAQRLYLKVTSLRPRFVYGWSNLGNTQTAFGELQDAEVSYTKAIDLCQESLSQQTDSSASTFGVKRCDDLYILLLNRGSLRLNNGQPKQALADLQLSNTLRARPDSLILQNLARAQEINGLYAQADENYSLAISMTANEVNPFWLRSALVKFQLGDVNGGFDLLKRVSNRFPEAPEVRAAYAVFLLKTKGDLVSAQQKFLEIPDRARLKYSDMEYLTKSVAWPPAMVAALAKVTSAVGDTSRTISAPSTQ